MWGLESAHNASGVDTSPIVRENLYGLGNRQTLRSKGQPEYFVKSPALGASLAV